jgi:MscS family membrane protein
MSLENVQEVPSVIGNRHIQAVVVVLLSYIGAKIVEWGMVRVLSRLGRRAPTELDDQVVEMLHRPIFGTVLLAGVAVALAIVHPPHPFGFIGFGLIKTLVVAIWFVFAVQLTTLLLEWMAQQPKRFNIVQPITVPLFEIGTKLVLIGGALYFILISWNVDVTGWLVPGGIIGIALGFAARDTLSNLFAGVFIPRRHTLPVGRLYHSGQRRAWARY